MLPLIGLTASLVLKLIRLVSADNSYSLAADVNDLVTDSIGIQDEAQADLKLADSAITAQLQTRLTEIALDAYKVRVQAYGEQRQTDLAKVRAFFVKIQGARSLTTTVADKGNRIGCDAPVVSVIEVSSLAVSGMAILGENLQESEPMRRFFLPSVNSVTVSIH